MSRGAAEYADVAAAARVLRGLNASSPPLRGAVRRLGAWGVSYGGLNALQAVARDSRLFDAAVSSAGIFNFVSALRYATDTGGKSYDADVQPPFAAAWRALRTGPMPHLAAPDWPARVSARTAAAWESSPASRVEAMRSPLLLIHGDADEEVPFDETVGCVRQLRELGVEPEVRPINNAPGKIESDPQVREQTY